MPQERRLVTILFADIVGSTTLTVSNDPEVVRERLGALFARTRQILLQHGATVEKFIGDAVMAVFGIPNAHEDDAERALRAAHAILITFALPNVGPMQRVELRVGVNTGEVATGSAETDQFLVTGESVNLAARLQAAAAPGEILAGALTRRLTAGVARFGPVRRVPAKGIGEVEAWPVEGLVSPVPSGGHLSVPSAEFVGRERELGVLAALWEKGTATGRPYLVSAIGPAGIGKTRLIDEFASGLSGALILRTRCPPYGEGLALWPIEQILGPMPEATQPNLVGAFQRHLEVLAQDGQVVLIVEDIHWAEPPMLDAIEQIVDRARGPIFVLCAARADLLASRPGWGGGRSNSASLALAPLDDAAVGALVASLDPAPAAASALPFVRAHGEGNPLFVQEYLRALREDDGIAFGSAVPPTLRGLIAARLDRVPPETRAVLRAASVAGRTFTPEVLEAIIDEPRLAERLADAERLEIIVPLDPEGIAHQRLSFVHMLFRDVAYAGVPKGERVRQHDRLSRWLETSETADLALAAHHAEQAALLAGDLGSDTATALAQRGFDSLRAAAEQRRARTDSHGAFALYRRALALADAADEDPASRLATRARAAMAWLRIEGSAAAIAELDAVLGASRGLVPADLLVQLLVWRSTISALDDPAGAEGFVAEAIEVAERAGDQLRLAYARWAAAELRAAAGDLEGQRTKLTAVLREMLETGTDYWLVPSLCDLAENALNRQDGAEAEAFSRDALLASEHVVAAIDRFRALEIASRVRLQAHDVTAAGRYAEAATVLARELGEPYASARAALAGAAYRRASGDLPAAQRLIEAALADGELVARPTMRGVLVELRAVLATIRAESGDASGAAALLARARAEAPPADVRMRRHLEAAEDAMLAASPSPAVRA
ncbi:MAG: AAA family ATPase [Chloroflexota bacterium]|nr:AAA family ATPase [Chloroflexota bacterium]